MSNHLDLKKGLDIPVKGAAARKVAKTVKPGTIAVKPTDFKGFLPRLLVKEGDRVLAGSPVMADKQNPRILVTAPVSGTVSGIVRGEKRKLLAVLVEADAEQSYADFGTKVPADADAVKDLLLKTGLWNALIQRPYGIQANPDLKPKAIFISTFSTAPLAADTEFTLGDRLADFQAGVNALGKLTDGGVHIGVNKAVYSSTPFHKVENAITHVVSGKHPAGNVGVQISHIAPIQKGETVWTMSPLMVAAFGHVINTGKLDLTRKVAVTGPVVADPAYVVALPGTPVKEITDIPADARVIGGDVLTGETSAPTAASASSRTSSPSCTKARSASGSAGRSPSVPKVHSSSWCYFSWLTPGKKYDMDTNLHGGPRAFVETKCFEDVTPMDIFPIYLIKACLAGDIEKMEKFGIYEVLPEDLALCDYVDPSKNDIQAMIQQGIDLMIKEMA